MPQVPSPPPGSPPDPVPRPATGPAPGSAPGPTIEPAPGSTPGSAPGSAPGSPLDLAAARRLAITTAEQAGALLREREHRPLGTRPKGSAGDMVTDLDLAAERLIVDRIRACYPHHRIVAEEAGVMGAADATCVWLVDPLDGTSNVVIGLPVYTVGIALCASGLPVLGVVHDPATDRTWSATRDGGALGPGDTPLVDEGAVSPAGPVLAWTQGRGVLRDDRTVLALKTVLESAAVRMLQLWAPLTAWVLLARGRIDGFVGYRAELVDLPAGALIAAEAGAVICGLDGTPFDHRIDVPEERRSFVAGRPELIDGMLEMVTAAAALEPALARAFSR